MDNVRAFGFVAGGLRASLASNRESDGRRFRFGRSQSGEFRMRPRDGPTKLKPGRSPCADGSDPRTESTESWKIR